MKGAEFSGPGRLALSEFESEDPRPGWVRLGVTAVGICGSDLSVLQGLLMPNEGVRPGHEVAGVVDVVGDGVTVECGSTVTVEPLHTCGSCSHCDTGFTNRCKSLRAFGLTAPGGMAEFLNVPASCLHLLPADLDRKVAALSEPLAVSFRGVRRGEVGVGSRVAVLGSGTIGLLAVLVARDAGASEIFATARYPRQAKLARTLGATQVFANAAALLDAVGDQLIDVVIESVGGTADTLTEAMSIARPGARIVVLGAFDGTPSIPAVALMARELTLVGSMCYARDRRVGDFALALEVLGRHRDVLAELITHQFSLDQVHLNRTGFLGDLIAWEDGVYGTSKSVFSGSARTCRPDGRGAPGGPRLSVGGAAAGGAEARLHGGDAAEVGAAGAA